MPKVIGHLSITAPIILDASTDQQTAAVMTVSLDHAYLDRIALQEHPEGFQEVLSAILLKSIAESVHRSQNPQTIRLSTE